MQSPPYPPAVIQSMDWYENLPLLLLSQSIYACVVRYPNFKLRGSPTTRVWFGSRLKPQENFRCIVVASLLRTFILAILEQVYISNVSFGFGVIFEYLCVICFFSPPTSVQLLHQQAWNMWKHDFHLVQAPRAVTRLLNASAQPRREHFRWSFRPILLYWWVISTSASYMWLSLSLILEIPTIQFWAGYGKTYPSVCG